MGAVGEWCLIESDPGVFTTLIKKIGVTGAQVEEMWALERRIFDNLKPVHGLIFLFKYVQDDEPSGTVVQNNDKVYFSRQVINNACATQAVINILLNCNHPDIKLGPELTKFKEFTMTFGPKMRGLTLSNSQTIRGAHNSMAQQTLFEFDPKLNLKNKDDAYHFIGYMPIDGRLYELDGLKDGPIDHGVIPDTSDWFDIVHPIIMKRINKYTDGEIHFNLLAIVSDKKMLYEKKIEELSAGMVTDDVQNEINRTRFLIECEEQKLTRYQREMARRRHNYLPFIVELLKILSDQDLLMPLYDKAKSRAVEKSAKRQKI